MGRARFLPLPPPQLGTLSATSYDGSAGCPGPYAPLLTGVLCHPILGKVGLRIPLERSVEVRNPSTTTLARNPNWGERKRSFLPPCALSPPTSRIPVIGVRISSL